MTPLSLDRTVRVSDDTVFRELNGEAVLLQLDAGMYYGLDAVGTRLWQLLAEHGHLRTVHSLALQEFEVDAASLERDLLQLITELADRRLVRLG
jgi:hypothetical protein